MTSMFQMAADDVERRIHWVQVATIAWMIAEAAASLFAAWRAHSPALLAFGGDSAIELRWCYGVFVQSPQIRAGREM